MKFQSIIKWFPFVFLLTVCSPHLHGQVTLPVPDTDAGELVAVLESDGPVFEKAKACQQLAINGTADAVSALAVLLDDEQLSTYARSALENISAPEVDLALREAAKLLAGDRLVGVLNSIGKRRDLQATGLLAELLNHKNPSVQNAAARALGAIGTIEAADQLKKSFAQAAGSSRISIAQGCLVCARRLVAAGETQQAVSLCNLLRSADLPQELHWAATYSAVANQGTAGVPLLLEMLDSGDSAQFRIALQAVRRIGKAPKLATELASRLEGQSAENQALLLITLGELGDDSVLPIVVKAVGNDASDTRIAAISALARLGDNDTAKLLLDLASTDNVAMANAAQAALVRLPGDGIDSEVVARLISDQPAMVLSAVEVAAKRNIATATPFLLRLTHSDDASMRQSAIQALGRTTTITDLPALIGLMSTSLQSDDSAIVQKTLGAACVRMPQDRCVQTLTSAMSEVSPVARVVLLDQLALVGGTKALGAVVDAAKSNDDTMQDAATRLLGGWLTADAATPLLELSKTLTIRKYQIRVLRGYIRIARQLDMTTRERMEVCRNALAIADRDDERKLVLDVLRRNPTPEGLQMASSLQDNETLRGNVDVTIQAIKAAITVAITVADSEGTKR
ncbi:HEAT repeat protein [Rubripirellula tenax]|uniref:HEAT repeat protein n=1 Tax=Rubripirellula tenax TaxID=2528015 RepID=A0A5C6FF99_9BACT|nr:HEAT repeat domain-containing protein [Rubripirellula tenax]TWU60486.1 HEAT repeat protein [Rubripirellula tenax]